MQPGAAGESKVPEAEETEVVAAGEGERQAARWNLPRQSMAWCCGEECHDGRATRIGESASNGCFFYIEKRGPNGPIRCTGLGSHRPDGQTPYREHFQKKKKIWYLLKWVLTIEFAMDMAPRHFK